MKMLSGPSSWDASSSDIKYAVMEYGSTLSTMVDNRESFGRTYGRIVLMAIALGSTRKASQDMRDRVMAGEFWEYGRMTPKPEQREALFEALAEAHGIKHPQLKQALTMLAERYGKGAGPNMVDFYDDLLDFGILMLNIDRDPNQEFSSPLFKK